MALQALIVPSLILFAGVVDDLRSRKVHNTLVLILAGLAVVSSLLLRGSDGLVLGLGGALAALLITLPLVLTRVLGAGDMKLFVAFGLATSWHPVLITALASLFWGALLGVTRAVVAGNGLVLVKNAIQLIAQKKLDPQTTTQIPYTVALLFGWMTFVSLDFYGDLL